MAVLALAMVVVYGWTALARGGGGTAVWAPIALRVLAVLGFILPGWAILEWYGDLSRARELTHTIQIDTGPIAERFVVNAAALLSLGFLLLVAGIFLARRVGARDTKKEESR